MTFTSIQSTPIHPHSLWHRTEGHLRARKWNGHAPYEWQPCKHLYSCRWRYLNTCKKWLSFDKLNTKRSTYKSLSQCNESWVRDSSTCCRGTSSILRSKDIRNEPPFKKFHLHFFLFTEENSKKYVTYHINLCCNRDKFHFLLELPKLESQGS